MKATNTIHSKIKDHNDNVVIGTKLTESHMVTQDFKLKYMRILDGYIRASANSPHAQQYFIETSEDLDAMPQEQWRCIIKYSEKLAAITFNEELLLNIQAEAL